MTGRAVKENGGSMVVVRYEILIVISYLKMCIRFFGTLSTCVYVHIYMFVCVCVINSPPAEPDVPTLVICLPA